VSQDGRKSPFAQALEKGASCVIRDDWIKTTDSVVAKDLRKYHTYCGKSVIDFLKAIRNKKVHYNQVSGKAKALLGEIPD
jgi:serine/threonine-protein kinase/endoribonuclease IRE1